MSTDRFSLSDRIALVTGGNGGLGLAMARGLQEAGASVAVIGRDEAKNREAGTVLTDDAAVFTADVRNEDEVATAIRYASAKTGVLGLTRALAVELAEHDIQVNAILPGWFETALTAGAPTTEWGERIRRKTPAARWGEPDDLIGAVVFLSSHASDFITGVSLPVDGGYAIADRLLPE